MTDKNKQLYLDFEAYERVAEPHKCERASAWRTAIGLQDVDGLKVSDYLKETAVRHIEGDITIDDVREQLKSYYVNKTTHDEDDAEKEEADRVAAEAEASRQAEASQQVEQESPSSQGHQQIAPFAGGGGSSSSEQGGSAYYSSCKEAKAAGAAPLFRGEPGYRPKLDRDGDGIACEK